LHYIAFQRYCEKYLPDFTLTEEFFEREIHGRSNANIFPALWKREIVGDELHLFADEKEACYRKLVAEVGITALACGKDFIKWAMSEGFKVAIVTNAPRLNAESMLLALDLQGTIDCLIIGMVSFLCGAVVTVS
jgi:beta-phosphoglucomutase-like phosphatase (HAD superfamily)